ncbi:unnamed protein product [Protopolystoma xenopodis]|uniref:Uncharacterized protein n=1 Tax=Protopolystoma xenopodis TaxID=117903 RepID=A0A448XPF9_9PLAT|nr:unnamed protein product [Protopolystoma xenopodis]
MLLGRTICLHVRRNSPQSGVQPNCYRLLMRRQAPVKSSEKLENGTEMVAFALTPFLPSPSRRCAFSSSGDAQTSRCPMIS